MMAIFIQWDRIRKKSPNKKKQIQVFQLVMIWSHPTETLRSLNGDLSWKNHEKKQQIPAQGSPVFNPPEPLQPSTPSRLHRFVRFLWIGPAGPFWPSSWTRTACEVHPPGRGKLVIPLNLGWFIGLC